LAEKEHRGQAQPAFALSLTGVSLSVQDLIQACLKKLYFRQLKLQQPRASEILTGHHFFSHLHDEVLTEILEIGNVEVFDTNTALFQQGDPATKVYFLLSGSVCTHVCTLCQDLSSLTAHLVVLSLTY
jgi:CRP-like cAMP-binding protein